MDNRTWYYGRVSSSGQNLARQISQFKALGAGERDIITDKASGKDFNRDGYKAMRDQLLRSGDTLVVTSIDRLGRNKEMIKTELQYFKDHGIRLKVLDIPTTMMDLPEGQEWIADMVTNILLEVLSSFAEHERLTIKKRQQEGIAAAKVDGVKFGRPTISRPDNFDSVVADWRSGKITAVQAYTSLNLRKGTFYKMVKEG
ncbi:MAG: recombinase family protein [Elusimicrobiaceae bacterium]|nr:recombinase family protein [Elusimicrobiaceae bacterium]